MQQGELLYAAVPASIPARGDMRGMCSVRCITSKGLVLVDGSIPTEAGQRAECSPGAASRTPSRGCEEDGGAVTMRLQDMSIPSQGASEGKMYC